MTTPGVYLLLYELLGKLATYTGSATAKGGKPDTPPTQKGLNSLLKKHLSIRKPCNKRPVYMINRRRRTLLDGNAKMYIHVLARASPNMPRQYFILLEAILILSTCTIAIATLGVSIPPQGQALLAAMTWLPVGDPLNIHLPTSQAFQLSAVAWKCKICGTKKPRPWLNLDKLASELVKICEAYYMYRWLHNGLTPPRCLTLERKEVLGQSSGLRLLPGPPRADGRLYLDLRSGKVLCDKCWTWLRYKGTLRPRRRSCVSCGIDHAAILIDDYDNMRRCGQYRMSFRFSRERVEKRLASGPMKPPKGKGMFQVKYYSLGDVDRDWQILDRKGIRLMERSSQVLALGPGEIEAKGGTSFKRCQGYKPFRRHRIANPLEQCKSPLKHSQAGLQV